MSKIADQQYLKNEQYKDASNLNARIALHNRFSTNPYGWGHWVFDAYLELLPMQARILELGCGPATLWVNNLARISVGWDITLSDFSDGMLDTARRKLVVSGRNFKFEQIDAQAIPYGDESFDVVIANHMLYHVPDRSKAIAEISRVLKPGGQLIATTVGDRQMCEINAWCQQHADTLLFPVMPFTLENGLAQLQSYFSQVEIRRYEDNLRITEIEPLMAYIHSSSRITAFSESALAELRGELERELQSTGVLLVTKDAGLFAAVK